jgi:hypothetical protein
MHLDIRTPFGETVGTEQVENALVESLGPRKEKFTLGNWHIQFVEDTNLGSNHRIFADLIGNSTSTKSYPGMDVGLPLEVAIEALGEMAMTESGLANFQLLIGCKDFCYSLLFLNGSPFHILKVNDPVGSKAATRLRQHRDFLLSQSKIVGNTLKALMFIHDPIGLCEAIQELKPQSLTFGIAPEFGQLNIASGNRSTLILHLGLAQAARQKDLLTHNRVPISDQARNDTIRSRNQFYQFMAATAILGVVLAATYGIAILNGKKQLQKLRQAASTYQVQVNTIHNLRQEKMRLEAGLQELRPVWNSPMNWSKVYGGLSAALPNESGIDGLSVVKKAEGGMELSFRAWVRDWGQVQVIQKKLLATPPFVSVILSEQRKDLATGVVIFNVTCQLDRI